MVYKCSMMRYLLAWFGMLAVAIANGALRQMTFAQHMAELPAHQLSTLIGSVVIGLFIWFVVRVWPLSSSTHALKIGVMWLALTVAFEFAMGRFISHRTWLDLLADYNLMEGRVWIVFLVWLALAPYIFYRLR